MRRLLEILFVVFVMSFTAGCYPPTEIEANHMAIRLERGKVQTVEGPGGVYDEWTCWYCSITSVSIDTLTFPVEDPEVLTKDDQSVSVRVTIQARRKSDQVSVMNMYVNWNALVDNQILIDTISATAREGMKNGTRDYTLTELLDDRDLLAGNIQKSLQTDADRYYVEIVNVTVENIGPSPEYMAILAQTSNINAQVAQSVKQQDLIRQKQLEEILAQQKRVEVANAQVLAEQAETEVQVEIARREGEVIKARNEVYTLNPQAYELERLKLLAPLFGNGTVYFVPQGTDLTLYFLPNGLPLPVPQ